jgi:hypothetical protein
VILELRERGADIIRFNTEAVPSQAGLTLQLSSSGAEGYLRFAGRTVELAQIRSIWYRGPAEPVPPEQISDPVDQRFAVEESEEVLFGLWRVLDCSWVSHPDALDAASYKPAQLQIGATLSFDVPRTIITNDPEEALEFVREVDSDVVIKPLRFGLVREAEGLQEMIFTNTLRKEDIDAGLERVRLCPWEKVEAFVERAAEVVESIGRFDDVPIMRSPRGLRILRHQRS